MNGDKNLFTWGNVSSFMQYEEPVTEADMEVLAGKLERLQDLLFQSGRKLFVFMTPCKVRYTEAELPWIDRVMAPKEKKTGNHDALKAALSESTVPYFDSISWVEEHREEFDPRVPLFPRTGVHWSVYVGNLAGAAFGEFLEQESGYDLPKLRITAEPSEDPVYPDADAFETFNLLGKPYDAYYAPVIEELEPGRDKPGVLFRGGSFMGQSLSMLIRQGYFGKDVYMENDQFFTDAFQNKVIFHDYDAVDMQEAFRDIDLVVLEVNEPSVPSMSFGFIDYVLEHPEVLDAS